ncbi:MAG: sterol desaturase family protein [Methylocystis sp.]|nr:sterol desaturase family protein [Methylocystis sp.]
MDLYSAIHFPFARIANEFFSAGSIFSVYSLATTFCVGICALAWRHKKRRGHINLPVIARAIFAKKFLTRESTFADMKLFVLSVVIMPGIVTALVFSANSVAGVVRGALTGAFGPAAPTSYSDLHIKLLSTLVLFLAYEIGYFVDHYLKHRVAFLWELHKLHHTADVLTPWVNFRNHPIDNIVFGYMLATFIGGASGVLAWLFNRDTETFAVDGKNVLFLFFLWTIGHLQHSQFWIPFRGFWGHVILSPAHHQIHHSNDPKHFNRNLGSVLAVWDWMAGTLEIPETKNPRLAYGVRDEGVEPHTTYGMLAAPAMKSAAALWASLASIAQRSVNALNAATQKTQRRPG